MLRLSRLHLDLRFGNWNLIPANSVRKLPDFGFLQVKRLLFLGPTAHCTLKFSNQKPHHLGNAQVVVKEIIELEHVSTYTARW